MNTAPKLNLLAGLDLSDMDAILINYIRLLEQWLPPAHITFLHNIKLSELPQELKAPVQLLKIAGSIEKKLNQLITATYTPSGSFTVIVTAEEFSELAFTAVLKKTGSELVLLGNKQDLEGSGGLNQQLIRMLPAAVLLVPETCRSMPSHILQAIDFSRHTQSILQWGQQINAFAPHGTILRLTPVYVSKMSYHFFPILSDEEVAASLKKEDADNLKKWRALFPGHGSLQLIHAHEKSIAATLLQYAINVHADVIILGVKGTASLTNLFMGSVANEMVQRETEVCLLLVK
ncbi:nucleotide-binding universal stress UspA family protein [Chitinophaga niastensis]|uniref:Nucleotide-binding universal stress UspA family protein n=1 Tax=Chitinophaga niastensis TaxID=536980 RepID=A0A2P8H9I6_CHINA|nr:universal stress protein [Chitinophaga niastensis]PSL42878.1 nucleotide-binding universal stress UspA family protein [Chitinophaga niastensis]